MTTEYRPFKRLPPEAEPIIWSCDGWVFMPEDYRGSTFTMFFYLNTIYFVTDNGNVLVRNYDDNFLKYLLKTLEEYDSSISIISYLDAYFI